MVIAIAFITGIITYDNAEFFRVAEAQVAEGYTWNKTDCRTVNYELPALTFDSPIGKDRICYKLEK
jgi:hypothetical protein